MNDDPPGPGNPYELFCHRIMDWHHTITLAPGAEPWCTCGTPAYLCPYQHAAYLILGHDPVRPGD